MDDLIKKIENKFNELGYTEEYTIQNDEVMKEKEANINKSSIDIDLLYCKYSSKLNELVGLEEVKDEIKKLIKYLIFIKKVGSKVNFGKLNLNMVFRGNPGTGKTTIAKIITKLLYDLGFLKSNTIIETVPSDFIGETSEETTIKTKEIIDRANRGVIFIDDAYTFLQSVDNKIYSYSNKAITEIIKEIENSNTLFIFSGNSKEMDNFIDLNPEIKSKIGYNMNFRDYTKEELFTMFKNKVTNSGMTLSDDIEETLLDKISKDMKKKNFDNGHMIDNLFDEIIREHISLNLYQKDNDKLLIITKESIYENELKKRKASYALNSINNNIVVN